MLATISENGRFGVVAVGDSHEQAEELYPDADDRPKRGATGHPGARHPRAKVSSALPRDAWLPLAKRWVPAFGSDRCVQTKSGPTNAKALLQTGDRMCGFWAGRIREHSRDLATGWRANHLSAGEISAQEAQNIEVPKWGLSVARRSRPRTRPAGKEARRMRRCGRRPHRSRMLAFAGNTRGMSWDTRWMSGSMRCTWRASVAVGEHPLQVRGGSNACPGWMSVVEFNRRPGARSRAKP